MMKDKRGLGINALYPAVLVIVLVGIVLGIGLYVMEEVKDNVAQDFTGTDGTVNATIGTSTLGDASQTGYKLITVDSVTLGNGTAGDITNYTFDTAGLITWGADVAATENNLVNISSTYNYDVTDSPEAAISTAQTGLAGLATWIAIIVVVIAAAIVLGIVLNSFGRRPGV